MRIIAGKYKGRQIAFPKHIRPTQDKVRQAIFDCLAGVISGAKVLDLFAGSGAMGIESLSRGAEKVCFIDKDRRCSLVIARNLEALTLIADESDRVSNYTNDAFRAIDKLAKKKARFDLVFIDPPYYQELAKKALKSVVSSGILAPRSFLVVERSKQDQLGDLLPELIRFKEAEYGDIKVSFFQLRAGS